MDPKHSILTHSGLLYEPGGPHIPTLRDIGIGLSRMPRFSGQGRRTLTVLDHTCFMTEMAARDALLTGDIMPDPMLILAILFHDAHEAFTGDVPTPFKNPELKSLQRQIDIDLMDRYYPGGIKRYDSYKNAVDHYDRRAMLAEAIVAGPAAFTQMDPSRFAQLMGGQPRLEDIELLRYNLEQPPIPTPPSTFVEWVSTLRHSLASTEEDRQLAGMLRSLMGEGDTLVLVIDDDDTGGAEEKVD